MATLFKVLGAVFWIVAMGSCAVSKSVMQETAGILLVGIGSLFLVGAALLDELRAVRWAIKPPAPPIKGPGDMVKK